MRAFLGYIGGTVIRPVRTLRALSEDTHRLVHGLAAILLMGGLYTFTVWAFAVSAMPATAPPFLKISADVYYSREVFFVIPVYVAGWILAAGLAQLLAKPFGGTGDYESGASALAFALVVPGFVTWIPETIGALTLVLGLSTPQAWLALAAKSTAVQAFINVYQLISLACYAVLFPVAVGVSQGLRRPAAIFVGLLTLVGTGTFLFVFIR